MLGFLNAALGIMPDQFQILFWVVSITILKNKYILVGLDIFCNFAFISGFNSLIYNIYFN